MSSSDTGVLVGGDRKRWICISHSGQVFVASAKYNTMSHPFTPNQSPVFDIAEVAQNYM